MTYYFYKQYYIFLCRLHITIIDYFILKETKKKWGEIENDKTVFQVTLMFILCNPEDEFLNIRFLYDSKLLLCI